MLAISLPDDNAGLVFVACATRTRSAAKRTALLAQRSHVEDRAEQYLEHALAGTLHEFDPVDPDGIEAAELSGLYGRVLVKGGERPLYLRLRGRSRYNRCPLCAQRDVKSLDHYLSKDEYPELAVFAANLTPACFECNHAKLNFRAELATDSLFHPYFDDWSDLRLIQATINIGGRVTTSFTTRSPVEFDPVINQRVQKHFTELNLAELYEQHAAVELVERKDMFRGTFESDGADGLREELEYEAKSRRRFNRNSWQSALYRALSRDVIFYSGGFEYIDEP
jgi:hypothetical protein